MFTPWRYCIDPAAGRLLDTHGWQRPPADSVPTGADLVARYLEPLGAALAPYLRLNTRVTGVTRKSADKVRTMGREDLPFVLRVDTPDGERRIDARSVIDASGTWHTPNPLGADGLPATGEHEHAAHIAAGIPDILGTARARYAGKTVAVVGSGHSALNVLIELAALRQVEPHTQILWLLRKAHLAIAFGGEDADALPQRGALGSEARHLVESGAVVAVTPFSIEAITRDGGRVRVLGDHNGTARHFVVDEIVTATGFRPDLSILREMRLALDPWLESAGTIGPLIDPNVHSCGTVRPHGAKELAHPETDFFIAGMKSYGRAPTFLLATGHEQVRSIAAALVGDHKAAARVELDLPETGVCSSRPAPWGTAAASACCTPATPQGVCCAPKLELPAEAPCCGTAAVEMPQLANVAASCCAAPAPVRDTANACCTVPERATS
jgi:hypothetical protein